MNNLAAWLRASSVRTVVLPDGAWVVVYEFDGRHLALCVVDEDSLADAEDVVAGEMHALAARVAAPMCDLRFRVRNGAIEFRIDNGEWGPHTFADFISAFFGAGVLKSGGVGKAINVAAQVRSPFQYWQRQMLSAELVAQDVDAWLSPPGLVALEFKQVRQLQDWTPYRADGPNFRSLLRFLGPDSHLVVVAAPAGTVVGANTPLRPFILEVGPGGRGVAHYLNASTAGAFTALLDGPWPPSGTLRPLKPADWH